MPKVDRSTMHRMLEAMAAPHVREMRLVECELAREAIAEAGAERFGQLDLRDGWKADAWRLPDGSLLRVEAWHEHHGGVALWKRGMPETWVSGRALDAIAAKGGGT